MQRGVWLVQCGVLPIEPEQRSAFARAAKAGGEHLADKYRVIASVMHGDYAAIQKCDALVDDRRAGHSGMNGNVAKGIIRHQCLFGKSFGPIRLLGAKNVKRQAAAASDQVVRPACFQNAYQDERRAQRDGSKRVGGHAMNRVAVANGQQGDAGRKAAHHGTKK